MLPFQNVSIAVIVFMGLTGGGLMALILMAPRKQQTSFSVMLALAVLSAVIGVYSSVATLENNTAAITNAVVLLVLTFTLGYILTTFSVLSPRKAKREPGAPVPEARRNAVILLAPGEPPEYNVADAARRLEFADDPHDVPPVLLRPFYMRDLKQKYSRLGTSPYREYHQELARKVQSRLDSSYSVSAAFYADEPGLTRVLTDAIDGGANRLIITHVRVTDPPDSVLHGDILHGIDPQSRGVTVEYAGPFSDPTLIPQIYVRRALEEVPQLASDPSELGLLLVGRGHSGTGSATARHDQELNFQRKVREALVKAGFDEKRVAIAWLRDEPNVAQALSRLIEDGCKSVLWMPSSYPADGINTLTEIPAALEPVAGERGTRLVALGAWNADDLAAEEIAAEVRASGRVAAARVL